MPNIFFCGGVITQEGLREFDDIFKDLLARGPSHGDNIEHIKNSVWSIRNNKKERVFFLFHEFQHKRYIVVLEVDTEHKYEKTKVLKDGVAKYFLEKNQAEIEAIIKANFHTKPPTGDNRPNNNNQEALTYTPVSYIHDSLLILDEKQQTAIKAKLPAIIEGPAGSGKTSIALLSLQAAAKKYESKILYVTQSERLADKVRQEWEALGTSYSQVEILSYSALVKTLDKVDLKTAHESQSLFRQWWDKNNKKYPAVAKLNAEAIAIYQELRILSGFNEADYLNIGQKQSLLFKTSNSEAQKALFKAYTAWIGYLTEEKLCLPDFYKIQNANACYAFAALDECHDFSHGQLAGLSKLVQNRNLMCFIDERQNVFDDNPKGIFLKNLFPGCNIIPLKARYRCPAKVWQVAEVVNQLRLDLTPKNKSEVPLNTLENKNLEEGQVVLINPNNPKEMAKLLPLKDDANTCVVTDETLKKEVNDLGFQLVLTPIQVKGFQFKRIICYKPLDNSIYKEINKALKPTKNLIEPNAQFASPLSEFFVTITRAEETLYICETENHDNTLIMERLKSAISTKTIEIKVEKSSDEEWEKRVVQLLQEGLEEDACAILNNTLKKSSDQIEQFIQTFKTGSKVSVSEGKLEQESLRISEGKLEQENKNTQPKKTERIFNKAKSGSNISNNNTAQKKKNARLNLAVAKQFHEAIRDEQQDKVKSLITKHKTIENYTDPHDKKTSLIVACLSGYKDAVRKLISSGANVEATNKSGSTTLMVAAENGHTEIVQMLIEAHVNVNAANEGGATALIYAVQNGHKEIVEMLIGAHANVNAATKKGATALILAAGKGYTEIVEMLINAGAKVDAADKNGFTPLMLAVFRGCKEIVAELTKAGANLNAGNIEALLNFCYKDQNLEVIKWLIEKDVENKINWMYLSPNNETVLTILCKSQKEALACVILEKILLENKKTNLVEQLIQGKSAIAYACVCQRFELVRIFLKNHKDSFKKMCSDSKSTVSLLKLTLNFLIQKNANNNYDDIQVELKGIVKELEESPNGSLLFSNNSSVQPMGSQNEKKLKMTNNAQRKMHDCS